LRGAESGGDKKAGLPGGSEVDCMRFLYNLLFGLFFALSAPYYFLKMWRRGNWREGFSQRFARYSNKTKQSITNRHVIWIHAVSVGEVNVCTQLIRALEPRVPNMKLVVSTTTSTGMGELRKRLPSHIEKIYYPIDRRKNVQRALSTMHPEAIILVEAEIWPNFLWRALDQKIPIFLINARLSERSYRGYRRFGFLFRDIFRGFSGVGCQNEADAERLRRLGFRHEAVHVVGNLKFEPAKLDERQNFSAESLLKQIGVPPDALILVGGSTHAGEEEMLGKIFLNLKPKFPKLFLVVVPRHFERGREAGRDLKNAGVKFIFRSEVSVSTALAPNSVDCLLVNSTGELREFYKEAAIVFVGKSMLAEGGQNPIEPAEAAKAVVFGPHMKNFEAIVHALVQGGGAWQVTNPSELEWAFEELLHHPEKRTQLGRNALRIVQENSGPIERTVEMILQHLDPEDVFIARPGE
jgi:3-deoxy-D-manno-octulosonic-acid transferase